MKKAITLLVMALTVIIVSTCNPDRGNRIDPVTGYPYPTLEPEVWEGMEN